MKKNNINFVSRLQSTYYQDEEKRLKRYDKLNNKILKYKIPIRKGRQYKIQRKRRKH